MEVTEVDDGNQAALLVEQTPFDMLLLDWDLPGRPGIEIARRVRGSGSGIPIIMVTAAATRDKVLEALDCGVSDYVLKPFDPDYLLGKVMASAQRYLAVSPPAGVAVRSPIRQAPEPEPAEQPAAGAPQATTAAPEEVQPPVPHTESGKPFLTGVLTQIEEVSTIPQMAMYFLEVANDPDATVDDLKEVLANDPALTTRVLRLVNSSAFSLREKITNLPQAIAYLGLKQIRNLAVAVSVSQLFRAQGGLGPYNRAALWHHMVAVGICARLLARHIGLAETEDVFLAGLLHDIGIVLEDQYVHQQFCRIIRALSPDKTLVELEREHLGFDHAMLGGRVAERWRFPHMVTAAIFHHHASSAYQEEDKSAVRCVELANALCSLQGHTSVGMNLVRNVDPGSLELPFSNGELDRLAQAAKEELAKSVNLFSLSERCGYHTRKT